ncbi:MAG: hypothetical protein RLZZ299_268 [Pseudomonadota bacterium]
MRVFIAPSWMLLVACGGAPATTHPMPAGGAAPIARLSEGGVVSPAPTVAAAPPSLDAVPPDAGTRALLSALRAHHAEDLLSAQELAARPGAEDSLAWIVAHESHVGVQARAVRAMGAFPTEATHARLLELWRDPARHVEVRAAAMRALADAPVSVRTPLEAEIADGLDAKDVRLVLSAIRAADGLESLADEVAELGRSHPSPLVREAASGGR